MDSALDFGSSGCGFESHQDRIASMAQRIAHRTSNPGVAGSNPAGGAFFVLFFLVWNAYFFECCIEKQECLDGRVV